eukprot:NODE_3704_length_752_cov_437.420373.p1 GENE.NODE_3704_length_752_cov_437.420373~~NODE_3704_length_752_cov_437.420373.p1  ORF type:complete len:234 (+),score=59.90 NODE_3704_length_752_cov_437.420373:3-704(+)
MGDTRAFIHLHFGSLADTFYTLHIACLGGVDWNDIATPLFSIHLGLGLLFMFQVLFSMLCLLNIITGIFVDRANKVMQCDIQYVQAEELSNYASLVRRLAHVFHIPETSDVTAGMITRDMFVTHITDYNVQSFLRGMGIEVDTSNAAGLFNLMDNDGDGEIELAELIAALMSLSGGARQVSSVRIEERVRALQRDIRLLFGSEQKSEHTPTRGREWMSELFDQSGRHRPPSPE